MSESVVSNATEDLVSDQVKTDDVVKYETHQKLLGQHKKTREQLGSLEAELSKYRQAEAEREQAKLADEGNFKEALKLKDEKLSEYQQKLNAAAEREANTWKLQSFYSKLPGKIKHNDYLAHAQIDKILYDSESMTCDNESVEAVVNDFMAKHAHLVEASNKAKLPNESPNNTIKIGDKITNTNISPKDALREQVAKMFGA